MIEIRAKNKISQEELDSKIGKVLTDGDSNILLTGAAIVRKPDGSLLAIYLPRVLKDQMDATYPTLTTIRMKTENRGAASGSMRVPDKVIKDPKTGKDKIVRTRSMPVYSAFLGAADPGGVYKFCRLTSFTSKEVEKWQELLPLFQETARQFRKHVEDRFTAQVRQALETEPEWIIPGTPFTTITVNNTYATGVHTDKGDLDEGFSCLAVARRGNYTGGILTFPEYRVGIDMQDGDLVLMDAHEYHGNSFIRCECGNILFEGPCKSCKAERVSVVHYYRTRMKTCGTAAQEQQKRLAAVER